jgi:hypothetical protein
VQAVGLQLWNCGLVLDRGRDFLLFSQCSHWLWSNTKAASEWSQPLTSIKRQS